MLLRDARLQFFEGGGEPFGGTLGLAGVIFEGPFEVVGAVIQGPFQVVEPAVHVAGAVFGLARQIPQPFVGPAFQVAQPAFEIAGAGRLRRSHLVQPAAGVLRRDLPGGDPVEQAQRGVGGPAAVAGSLPFHPVAFGQEAAVLFLHEFLAGAEFPDPVRHPHAFLGFLPDLAVDSVIARQPARGFGVGTAAVGPAVPAGGAVAGRRSSLRRTVEWPVVVVDRGAGVAVGAFLAQQPVQSGVDAGVFAGGAVVLEGRGGQQQRGERKRHRAGSVRGRGKGGERGGDAGGAYAARQSGAAGVHSPTPPGRRGSGPVPAPGGSPSGPPHESPAVLVPMRLSRIILSDINEQQVLCLSEVDPDDGPEEARTFPILVGEFEANSIRRAVTGDPAPRPLTHDLLKSAIEELGAEVKDVVISHLQDHTYYAQVRLKAPGGKSAELDSRPSDAIALAVHHHPPRPILVSETVLDEVA